jgi:uncharacterized protein (UPF0332 family)
MSISSADLLSLAQELAGHDKEVHWRDAASRAYYAAFHWCQPVSQTLSEPRYDSNVKGIHDYLIKKFEGAEGTHKNQLKAIAYLLKAAKNIRVKADYEIQISFEKHQAQQNIKYAERIYQLLQLIETKKK